VAAGSTFAPASPGATASPSGSSAGPASPGATPTRQVPGPGGSSAPPRSAPVSPEPVPSSAPPRAGGAPGGAPAGAAPNGLAMPYRTVQRELGYFEGVVTVTNRTSAPLSAWELSFSYPGAQVRTVWGGVLVQAGSQVTIRNDPATGPIPPGGTYAVRFGAGGVPSAPGGCRFGGRECGFTP
jgi:cellulose binding protein with CBM2 domain